MRGQIYWPPLGNSSGHGWAVLLATTGQITLAIDTRSALFVADGMFSAAGPMRASPEPAGGAAVIFI